ncbi:MAG: hypothetical protein HYU36_22025 [Planctomycetes bacterium]|nr:hypothetical protein [Planctomycetota bacterium]
MYLLSGRLLHLFSRFGLLTLLLACLTSCGGGGGGPRSTGTSPSDGNDSGTGTGGGGDTGGTPAKPTGGTDPDDVASLSIFVTSPSGRSTFTTTDTSIDVAGVVSNEESIALISFSTSGGASGTIQSSLPSLASTKAVTKAASAATPLIGEWARAGVPLVLGDNVITVTVTDQKGKTAQTSFTVVRNSALNFCAAPQAIPDFLFLGEPTPVVFRVAISSNPDLDLNSVKIHKIDAANKPAVTLATLKDDGDVAAGDDIKSDGQFTGRATVTESAEGYLRLRVSADVVQGNTRTTDLSEILEIPVVAHLTDAEANEAAGFPALVKGQFDAFTAALGETEARKQTLAFLKSRPEIVQAGITRSGSAIWYALESGMLGGVFVGNQGVKGGRPSDVPRRPLVPEPMLYTDGEKSTIPASDFASSTGTTQAANDPTSFVEIDSKKVVVISPFATQGGDLQIPPGVYDTVFSLFQNATGQTFDTAGGRILDSNANVALFKTLKDSGVVVLDTHGGALYDLDIRSRLPLLESRFSNPASKVVLLTGEAVTSTKNKTLEVDLLTGRLAIISGFYAVTPAFMAHYNRAFPTTVFYAGSCGSLLNSSMAAACIGNRAGVYFGFTEDVTLAYDNNIANSLFTALVNQVKTTSVAFTDTVNSQGTNDGKSTLPAHFMKHSPLNVSTKAGIVNGGFETGNIVGWTGQGDVRVICELGPLLATQGELFAIISTGLGSVGDSNSLIRQTVSIPAGVTKLSFDYDVVSEEPTEFIGLGFDDTFEATMTTTAGTVLMARESIDTSQWFSVTGIDFDGGDTTVFRTGKKTIEVDVSAFAGGAPITIEFRVFDTGDSIFDTALLLDNVKLKQ